MPFLSCGNKSLPGVLSLKNRFQADAFPKCLSQVTPEKKKISLKKKALGRGFGWWGLVGSGRISSVTLPFAPRGISTLCKHTEAGALRPQQRRGGALAAGAVRGAGPAAGGGRGRLGVRVRGHV